MFGELGGGRVWGARFFLFIDVMKRVIVLSLLPFFLFLTACANSGVRLQLRAAASLNPDPLGVSYPVVLRIYQLNSPATFTQATFKQLWQHDKQLLGTDLLKREEILLTPKSQRVLTVTPEGACQYIGVMGLFQQAGSQWRGVARVRRGPLPRVEPIRVLVKGAGLVLS